MNKLAKKQESNIQTINSGSQYQKMIELAITSNADIDKLERLMDLQERWEAKEAKKAFNAAMSSFQSTCPTIIARKQGHNYKYAPMCDVVSQVGKLIADNGLSYRFEQTSNGGNIFITCIVSHLDGHSERLTIDAQDDKTGSKNSVQAKGSTITYLKRYSFLGSFGIATADEDIDARTPPKPVDKKGNWRAGSDPKYLPETLRNVFYLIFEAYEVEDFQTVCEKFSEFGLIEERNAIWKCFASDERSAITKFTNSDEYTINTDIQKVDYLAGDELDKFLERFAN
jgi:hypothetical protein